MKKFFFIIDDATKARAAIFEKKLPSETTEEDAKKEARNDWERLTSAEQKERDAFYLIRAEEDADGVIDWNSAEIIYTIK